MWEMNFKCNGFETRVAESRFAILQGFISTSFFSCCGQRHVDSLSTNCFFLPVGFPPKTVMLLNWTNLWWRHLSNAYYSAFILSVILEKCALWPYVLTMIRNRKIFQPCDRGGFGVDLREFWASDHRKYVTLLLKVTLHLRFNRPIVKLIR